MTDLNLTAIKLYFAVEKNKQVLDVITDLLNQKPVKEIMATHGIARPTVYKIAKTYAVDMTTYSSNK